MAILVNVVGYENAPWIEVFRRELPEFSTLEPHQVTDPAEIVYAAIWQHTHNDLQRYQNLRAVLNLGAGTDHIDKDPALERIKGIPVVRLIDPDVGIDMAQYVMYWSMHFQRDYEHYRQQANLRHWQRNMWPRATEWRVTVLGLGRIGEFIAKKVSQLGFVSQAWNRSEKQLNGVRVYSGYDQLDEALQVSEVVVNCLPLNDQTIGLLNQTKLDLMPAGSYLINISRGAVVDEPAVTSALQSGQLAGAALDCFTHEPLSAESLLWSLPNVHITPHISGATFARSAAMAVVENIRRMERGKEPEPIHRMT